MASSKYRAYSTLAEGGTGHHVVEVSNKPNAKRKVEAMEGVDEVVEVEEYEEGEINHPLVGE